MVNFLFWNIKRNPVQETIANLARMHEIDVIILAECNIKQSDLLNELNSSSQARYSSTIREWSKIKIFTRFPGKWLVPLVDTESISIRHLSIPVTEVKVLLVAAHLPSKLYKDDLDLALMSARWRDQIEDAEEIVGHRNTIIVGDLNMDPFHPGVVSSEGLHGVMDKKIASKVTRKVTGEQRRYFYNPMWSLFGDHSDGPPGTYYYNASSRVINYYWHLYDQVLLRPELIPFFPNEEVRILTSTESASLITNTGIPDKREMSDHLPLIFRLELPMANK